MHQGIYDELVKRAKAGKTVAYAEVAPLADLDMSRPDDRNEIARLLDEISSYEHEQGRPLLSALVVHGGDEGGIPGGGFFTLAKRLGLFRGGDKIAFFALELNRLFAAWANKA